MYICIASDDVQKSGGHCLREGKRCAPEDKNLSNANGTKFGKISMGNTNHETLNRICCHLKDAVLIPNLSAVIWMIDRNGRFSFKVIHRLTLREGRGVNRESPVKLKHSMYRRYCHQKRSEIDIQRRFDVFHKSCNQWLRIWRKDPFKYATPQPRRKQRPWITNGLSSIRENGTVFFWTCSVHPLLK